MSTLEIVLILVAGLWAGLINTIVGSGTLVTFPVLVSLGFPPVTATISNAMGLIAGNLTGAWAYRSKLKGLGRVLLKLLPCSLVGGVLGAYLLLHLPASVFETIAPILIAVALLFVIFQPKLQAVVKARRARADGGGTATSPGSGVQTAEGPDAEEGKDPDAGVPDVPESGAPPADGSSGRDAGTPPGPGATTPAAAGEAHSDKQPLILYLLTFFAGVYGGYFVAAQGVLLLGILGVFLLASLQGANAIKTVLVSAVNIIAAVSYVIFAFDRIDWWVVLLIAVSSTVGSWIGAKVGMRLSPGVLRSIIVVLGVAAMVKMIFFD